MKLLDIIFIFLFCLISLISCKKETQDDRDLTLEYCQDNMIFSCDHEPQGNFYFKGKIDGEDFCVSSEQGYIEISSVRTITVTSTQDPVFTPGASAPISSFYGLSLSPPNANQALIPEDFAPVIILQTPHIADSIVYAEKYYLDKYMKEGDVPLINNSCNIDKYEGFFFGIVWGCKLFGANSFSSSIIPVWLSPVDNMQDDMTFRISELSVEYFGTYREYDITLELECDLYHYQASRKNNKHFGRLTEGVFRTKFTTPN